MDKLNSYNSLKEVNENFDVEFINNESAFRDLISEVDKKKDEEIVLYRGVSSPTYKMYSSSQRFYCDKKRSETQLANIGYHSFLKQLYDISKKLDNDYLSSLYDNLRNYNYIRYVNTDKNFESPVLLLDYNPIWAFHTLQHFTACSPFLDFSIDFYIALYFAAKEIIEQKDSISKQEIENYIEVVSIEESDLIQDEKYVSLTDKIFTNIKGCESFIPENIIKDCFFDELNKSTNKEIKYVCYGGKSIMVSGKGINYRFSFQNDNCIAQSGRLFMNPTEEVPFEELWNETFNVSIYPDKKLKVYLIHKSLLNEIFDILSRKLFQKIVQPIKKDYKEEIIQLISSQNINH